ncbi:MAG: glycosyltransferase family 4 protein [Actinomycetota bacterium]
MSVIRVGLVAEQLLQEVPGGIGTYVRAMMRRLPSVGIELEPVVAMHRRSTLVGGGLPHARRLPLPRPLLYRRWTRGHAPGVGGTSSLVHAPSMAFPPRDARPLVVTVHDLNFREFPDAYPASGLAFHEAMLRRLSDASLVMVPSRATAEALAASEHAHGRVRVVPMGTDMEAPSPEDRDRILGELNIERPYVLWMGTLEPRKNPEGVMRGFVHALESGLPDAAALHLYMVGPRGWWSGDLAELIAERGLSERVRRINEQPIPVRAALYSGASAFVFPSLAEGFGLPILEAMACGAPVVTSNRSSMPEVAGAAAEFCDPSDPASIGSAIAKVLRDPELAEDLRRAGYKRAREFTWERTARRTVTCYREALSGSTTS